MNAAAGHRKIRFGLLAAALFAALLVVVMVLRTPNLDRVDLIRGDNEVIAVKELQPAESYSQPVYIYRSFEHIEIIRVNPEAECRVGIEILQEGQPLFSEELPFDAGQEICSLHFAGEAGTYTFRLENHGETTLSLPMVENHRYDVDKGIQSEEPLLQISIYRESRRAMWTYLTAVFMLLLLTAMIACSSTENWNRRKSVLCILSVCLVFLLLFPAWNINDFGTHFATAWSFANTLQGIQPEEPGDLMIRADDDFYFRYVLEDNYQLFYQPSRRSYDDAVEFIFQPVEQGEMIPYTGYFRLLRDYGVWNYIPYVLGILIGRVLGLNLIAIILLARLCGIAFYTAGIYLALRRLPERMTLPVTVLSCLPMCALNLTAISYDALCFVLVLNLFAFLFALREKYRTFDAVCLALCSLALGMAKGGAYVPFVLSVPLLMPRKDKWRRNLLIICMAAALAGLAFNYRHLLLGRSDIYQFGGEGVGTYYARWALEHPVQYLLLMARTYLRQTDKIYSVVGLRLGWNAAVLPEYVCGLFFVLLLLSSARSLPEGQPVSPLRRSERFWLWIPGLLIIVLTPVMLLSNTFAWMDTVDGVQGRYFLPLLVPLLLLCDHHLRGRLRFNVKDSALLSGGIGILSLMSVYYIGLAFLRI